MKIDIEEVERRKEYHERICLTGTGDPSKTDLGLYVLLWRQFRDKRETWEVLPMMIAQLNLETMPVDEPNVARAKLYQRVPSNAPLAVIADLVLLKMATP